MTCGKRWFLMAALPAALAFAACGSSSHIRPVGPVDGSPGDSSSADLAAGMAILTVNPPSVDFGCVAAGVNSSPVVVTVTNVGTTASGLLSVTVSGDGFSATGCAGMALEPQGACTISVTAKGQTELSPLAGTIEVGDHPASTKKISVSGICIGMPLGFSLAPTPLDLGSVPAGKSVSGTIALTNLLTKDLTNIAIAVSGDGFSLSPMGTCTATLAPNQFCKIEVTYTGGSTAGPAKGTVTVSQGGVTKYVAVTATVLSPPEQADAGALDLVSADAAQGSDTLGSDVLPESGLSLTPSSASLLTLLGTPSVPSTFYVTGDLSSAPLTVTIIGVNKDDFSFTTDCDKTLAGSDVHSCQVAVVYNPKVAPVTKSTATLTLSNGDASATATLTGQAVAGGPPGISGSATDFGTVVVGNTSTELTFTITNAGGDDTGPVQVSTSAPFAVATDNCTGKVIAAKTTCTFTGVFKPVVGDAGVIQGTFKATLGPEVPWPTLISVTGTAVPPAKLAINPKALEFGSLAVLQESTPQTLTVSNTGGAPTGVLKVDKVGAQFAIESDTCTGTSLTPSDASKTCAITVTYTPAAQPSEATGNITVTDVTGSAGAATATLHGQGVPSALVMSPSSVCPQIETDDPLCIPSASTNRFSNMPIGQATPEMTFVLTSTTDPMNAPDSGELSVNLEGEAAADFTVTSNTCRAPLVSTTDTPPTCSLTVIFKPTAAGLRKAVLEVTTSRGGSAQATLEGKGLT